MAYQCVECGFTGKKGSFVAGSCPACRSYNVKNLDVKEDRINPWGSRFRISYIVVCLLLISAKVFFDYSVL